MGEMKTDDIFRIKPTFVEPLPAKKINNEPNTANPTSPKIAQEGRTGLSGDMQKFLLFRNFDFFGKAGSTTPPPSNETPTYPNAPLFSEGTLEADDNLPTTDANGNTISDGDSVHYNDVAQGQQNNCFLMAAVASLARTDPQAIHDMIQENRDTNGNVTSYTVKLYKDGQETNVTVDASELLSNGANQGDNGEVWVAVIEAAYAKLNGGTSIWEKGGSAAGALETLTGKSSRNHGVDGSDYSFEDLQNDFNAGTNVTLLTPGEEDDKKGKVAGSPYNLHNWHFYVVENVYVDETTGQQMVQLHNPWGQDHPKPIPFNELDNYFSQFQTN